MIELTDEDRGDIQLPRRRTAARVQISENVLFAAGFDRPTVEALRVIVNKVGNSTDTPTLPETAISIDALEIAPTPQPYPTPDDNLAPVVQLAEQVEFLQTELRALSESVALLHSLINDLKQGIYP